MRNEIDLWADQALRDIHSMTVRACRKLDCYQEYRALQIRENMANIEAEMSNRCYWNE